MTGFLTVGDVSRARGFPADLFADIEASGREWLVRGAHELTVPLDRGAGIRWRMRDPDGFLIEVGRATGPAEGRFTQEAPAGAEAGGTRGR